MLLHETDPARGGAPIEQLQADCPDDWRSDIFVPYRPIIPWLRVKDFKVVSLKMIVSSMLQHQSKLYQRLQGPAIKGSDNVEEDSEAGTGVADDGASPPSPNYRRSTLKSRMSSRSSADVDKAPKRKASDFKVPDLNSLGADLFMPGEVTRQQLVFPIKTTLIVSAENPGAGRLVQEILKKYPNLKFDFNYKSEAVVHTDFREPHTLDGVQVVVGAGGEEEPAVQAAPHNGRTLHEQLQQNRGRLRGPHMRSWRRKLVGRRNRFFMLYLNQQTWLGAEGGKLADQVRAARAEDITVILVHECDPMLGGCEFGSFFQTTPQDLISDGLYARIAVAFHTGQHRAVSLCMLAREINAVNYNSIHKFCMEAKLRLTGSASRNRSTSKMVSHFIEAENGRASSRSSLPLPAQRACLFEDHPNEEEGQAASVGESNPSGAEDPQEPAMQEPKTCGSSAPDGSDSPRRWF
jgi:hypothetical protein